MEGGKAIAQPAMKKIAEVLSEKLQRKITVEDLSTPNEMPDKDHFRPTLRELRMKAGLTIPELAALSGVKYFTIGHMEDGRAVSYITAQRVFDALGKRLQRKITAEQIDKLNIKY
jgi:DNA-binding XRE family transcriptional regulator